MKPRLLAVGALLLNSLLLTRPASADGIPKVEDAVPLSSSGRPEGEQIVLLQQESAPFSGLLMDSTRAAWYADTIAEGDAAKSESQELKKLSEQQQATIDAMRQEIDHCRKPINRPGVAFAAGAGIATTVSVVLVLVISGATK